MTLTAKHQPFGFSNPALDLRPLHRLVAAKVLKAGNLIVAGTDKWMIVDETAISKRFNVPVCFENAQPLRPDQCGGVLMSADGTVVGLNIARSDRAGSRAIPACVIADFLQKNVKP